MFELCAPIAGLDPAIWRIDIAGRIIRRHDYGIPSDYGWIDGQEGFALHWRSADPIC